MLPLQWSGFFLYFVPSSKKSDGSALSSADSLKRHVFDSLELFLFPFISLIVAALNRDGKRIGDLLAGTRIVDARFEPVLAGKE